MIISSNKCFYDLFLKLIFTDMLIPYLIPVINKRKRPSKQYYRQLTPHTTCPSESSADTNFTSKRSHHNALQSPPPSISCYIQPSSWHVLLICFQLCHSRYSAFQCGLTHLEKIIQAFNQEHEMSVVVMQTKKTRSFFK